MRLNDEQNVRFMNDKRRIEAQKRLDDAVKRIQSSVRSDGNAGYYLTVLPAYLKKLEEANENLSIVEATVEAEVLGAERFHAYSPTDP